MESVFQQREFDSNSAIVSFCVYSLPDALWLLSAIVLFGTIWSDNRRNFLFYSSAFAFMSILCEFFQFFGIIPGTFDIADVLAFGVSFGMGLALYTFLKEIKENES